MRALEAFVELLQLEAGVDGPRLPHLLALAIEPQAFPGVLCEETEGLTCKTAPTSYRSPFDFVGAHSLYSARPTRASLTD